MVVADKPLPVWNGGGRKVAAVRPAIGYFAIHYVGDMQLVGTPLEHFDEQCVFGGRAESDAGSRIEDRDLCDHCSVPESVKVGPCDVDGFRMDACLFELAELLVRVYAAECRQTLDRNQVANIPFRGILN